MIVDSHEFTAWSREVTQLHREAARVLEGLDALGLYQAGGHLSMAMDAMLQAQRERSPGG